MGGTLNSTAGTYDLGVNRSIALTASGILQVDAGALTVSGAISGAQTLTKTGSGTLLLTGTSSYSGVTTLSGGITNVTTFANSTSSSSLGNPNSTAASRLVIDNATLLHDAANVATTDRRFNVGVGGATLDSSAASSTNTLSFTNSGALQANSSGNRTLTLTGSNTGDNTLGSIIVNPSSGATSLSKTGAGKWVLNGINTYTGATNVTNGKLVVNGNISTSSLTSVSSGATLAGSGTVGAASVLGTLAIGNSPGTMNFASLALGSGSTYLYEMIGGSTSADLGDISGALTIDTASILDLVELGTYTLGNKFTLFAYDGALTGNFSGLTNNATFLDDLSNPWQIKYDDATAGLNGGVSASNTYVTITAIPEPNAAMLIGGLGMLALLRRRRY